MSSKLVARWNWKRWPVVLASAAISVGIVAVVVSITNLLQGPTSTEPPNGAEWLSAISTFWGAVAAALGAALTGGALLIAALTYQRQIRDRHAESEDKRRYEEKKRRQQAEAVTVNIEKYLPRRLNLADDPEERLSVEIRNDSLLAIYGVALIVTQKGNKKDTAQQLYMSILPSEPKNFIHPERLLGGAYAMFTDTAGVRWKRWHNGDLMEIPHYPKPDES